MFLFLISQPDLEHSGVIPLRERRWSRAAAGMGSADIAKALEELAAARFVVYDEDAEELLVRSLMRWDGVWKQPNVAKSAAAQIRTVASPALRAEIGSELARLGPDDVHQDVEELRLDLLGGLENARANILMPEPESASAASSVTPSGTPSATPSARSNGTTSRGGQGKGNTGSTTGNSPSPRPFPGPSPVPPPAAGMPAERDPPDGQLPDMPADPPQSPSRKANRLAGIYTELVPVSNFPAVAKVIRKAVDAGVDDSVIEAGVRKIAAENRSLTTEALRVAIYGPPRDRPTSEDRAQQALDAGAQAAAMLREMNQQ